MVARNNEFGPLILSGLKRSQAGIESDFFCKYCCRRFLESNLRSPDSGYGLFFVNFFAFFYLFDRFGDCQTCCYGGTGNQADCRRCSIPLFCRFFVLIEDFDWKQLAIATIFIEN